MSRGKTGRECKNSKRERESWRIWREKECVRIQRECVWSQGERKKKIQGCREQVLKWD